jgi:hypothetical protein
MNLADKTFDLATGQCVNVRFIRCRRAVVVTVAAPHQMQMYPTGHVRCLTAHVRTFVANPNRVWFENAYLDASADEAEAIVAFVRGAAR